VGLGIGNTRGYILYRGVGEGSAASLSWSTETEAPRVVVNVRNSGKQSESPYSSGRISKKKGSDTASN